LTWLPSTRLPLTRPAEYSVRPAYVGYYGRPFRSPQGGCVPPTGDERAVYEVRVQGCADDEETEALLEPIARLLCPDPHHASPCEIPWSTCRGDAGLVVGVYASHGQVTQVAERIRAFVGERRRVVVREGDAELYEDLIEQYRIENGLNSD
jgi:hypothetical protein